MHATSQEPAGTAGPQTAPAGWPRQRERKNPGANGKALPGLGGSGQGRQGHARTGHKRRAGGRHLQKWNTSLAAVLMWSKNIGADDVTGNSCDPFKIENARRRHTPP
ncbi:hypothetical protein GCM10007923_63760 [Shinella yambaruensis]|uniref:Uncharacterized protein n=1 Tax=Shinella yambaruensis TaxID=415996 RepID=A0ABQ5ZSN0_9HYPH|nr:hypothetical protein GCM10007923_63760 [Shinella yambaruensis]